MIDTVEQTLLEKIDAQLLALKKERVQGQEALQYAQQQVMQVSQALLRIDGGIRALELLVADSAKKGEDNGGAANEHEIPPDSLPGSG